MDKQDYFLKPLHDTIQPCLICPPKLAVLQLDTMLAVGFGSCSVTKNGEEVYSEQRWDEEKEKYPSLGVYELLAQREPDNDWRVHFHAPLYDAEYQRQDKESWVLVRKGLGFA